MPTAAGIADTIALLGAITDPIRQKATLEAMVVAATTAAEAVVSAARAEFAARQKAVDETMSAALALQATTRTNQMEADRQKAQYETAFADMKARVAAAVGG